MATQGMPLRAREICVTIHPPLGEHRLAPRPYTLPDAAAFTALQSPLHLHGSTFREQLGARLTQVNQRAAGSTRP